MRPINIDQPMVMYFKRIHDMRDFAEAVNQMLDQAAIITTVYNMMKDVGVLNWDISTWEAKPEVEKTFHITK